MSHFRRSLLALTLGLALGSSAASATALSWGTGLAEDGLGLSRFFEGVLARAFELPRTVKAGCSINPDGQPVCAPKLGCSIDPNGRTQCPPIITPKHGCSISPDGHT